MAKTRFVQVIFTDEERLWLQEHLASLEETEMVLKVVSAVDDATVVEDDTKED